MSVSLEFFCPLVANIWLMQFLSHSLLQFTSFQQTPSLFPPLHFLPHPYLHRASVPPLHSTQEELGPELLVQMDPQWLPEEKSTEQLGNEQLEYQYEGKNDEQVR